jgi:hypothetical protein
MLAATHASLPHIGRGRPSVFRSRRGIRGLGSAQTDQYIGTGVATGVSIATTVPALLPALIGTAAATGVGLVALPLIAIITSIFGQHAAAVAAEAKDLNGAVPAFATALQAIFAAANSGQISASQGLAYVDQAVQTYYSQVGGLMKKGQSCSLNSDCSNQGGSQPGNVSFSPCNGPCSVGCNFVEPAACLARLVLQTGGSATTPSLPSHAGFSGQPALTLSYAAPIPMTSPAQVTSGNSVQATGMVSPAAAATPTAQLASAIQSVLPFSLGNTDPNVVVIGGAILALLALRAIA